MPACLLNQSLLVPIVYYHRLAVITPIALPLATTYSTHYITLNNPHLHEPVQHAVNQRGSREVRDVSLRVFRALGVPQHVRRAEHDGDGAYEEIFQIQPRQRDRGEGYPRHR